jgi:hypothetical protein
VKIRRTHDSTHPPLTLGAPPDRGYGGEDLILTSGCHRRLTIQKKTHKNPKTINRTPYWRREDSNPSRLGDRLFLLFSLIPVRSNSHREFALFFILFLRSRFCYMGCLWSYFSGLYAFGRLLLKDLSLPTRSGLSPQVLVLTPIGSRIW